MICLGEGSCHDLAKSLKEEGCTIKVQVRLCLRGRYHHAKSKAKREDVKEKVHTASCVHVDTKPAVFGLLTE